MTITISKPSRLNRAPRSLVLDTSVVLNLLACGAPACILEALGGTFFAPIQVVQEIVREPTDRQSENPLLAELLDSGILKLHRLEGSSLDTFVDLAGAPPPDGLDDGEAATIAAGEEFGCGCVIDERKATRIASARRPDIIVLSTVDLFFEVHNRSLLKSGEIAELLYGALYRARMRVPDSHGEWVVELIGQDRANNCASLGKILRRLRQRSGEKA